jgi:hypothetical protein
MFKFDPCTPCCTEPVVNIKVKVCFVFTCIACTTTTKAVGGAFSWDGATPKQVVSGCSTFSIPIGDHSYTAILPGVGEQQGMFTVSSSSTTLTINFEETGYPACNCGSSSSITLSALNPNPKCRPTNPFGYSTQFYPVTFSCQKPLFTCYLCGDSQFCEYPAGYIGMFGASPNYIPFVSGGYYELSCSSDSGFTVTTITPCTGGAAGTVPSLVFNCPNPDAEVFYCEATVTGVLPNGTPCSITYTLT